MMFEKLEKCPRCSAAGAKWNYDAQVCLHCGWTKQDKEMKVIGGGSIYSFSLPEGRAVLRVPKKLSTESYQSCYEFINLTMKEIKRASDEKEES